MGIVDTQNFAIPSNPEDQKKIVDVFRDMSNQLIKAEATKEYVKEAKKSIKEEYDIPMNVINKLFTLYHNDNANNYFEEQRDIETFYETLFEKGGNNE